MAQFAFPYTEVILRDFRPEGSGVERICTLARQLYRGGARSHLSSRRHPDLAKGNFKLCLYPKSGAPEKPLPFAGK